MVVLIIKDKERFSKKRDYRCFKVLKHICLNKDDFDSNEFHARILFDCLILRSGLYTNTVWELVDTLLSIDLWEYGLIPGQACQVKHLGCYG